MLLRCDPFISLWTFCLDLCLGNLYARANTCIAAFTSLFCGQTCHFALCRFQRRCMTLAGSLTPLQDEVFREREEEIIQGSFGRFLSGWCCGPACVNDFLKWRPGPTLCGNQQSRSQNAQEGEGVEDASCLEKRRSGGTLLY